MLLNLNQLDPVHSPGTEFTSGGTLGGVGSGSRGWVWGARGRGGGGTFETTIETIEEEIEMGAFGGVGSREGGVEGERERELEGVGQAGVGVGVGEVEVEVRTGGS